MVSRFSTLRPSEVAGPVALDGETPIPSGGWKELPIRLLAPCGLPHDVQSLSASCGSPVPMARWLSSPLGRHLWSPSGTPGLPCRPESLPPRTLPSSLLQTCDPYSPCGFLARDWAFQKWDCVPARRRSKRRASGIRPAIRVPMTGPSRVFHTRVIGTGVLDRPQARRKGLPLLRSVLLVTVRTANAGGVMRPLRSSPGSPTTVPTRTPTGPAGRRGSTTSEAAARSRRGTARTR